MAALRERDPAIKLFGHTIPLLVDSASPAAAAAAEVVTRLTNDINNTDVIPCTPNKLLNVEATPFCSNNSKENDLQAINRHSGSMENDPKSEEIKIVSDGSGQENIFKKPDKIVPCPRCNSMETKFCYFNNYNVNQPRHFCRNCQRYWTAGGNIRNVPVGSGRRRNKHASSYRHAMMSCDIPAAHGDVIHHLPYPLVPPVLPGKTEENGTVTESGSEMPICKSGASILNAGEQKITDLVSISSGDNKEEQSCASSAAVSGSSENRMPDNMVEKELINVSGYCNGVTLPRSHVQSYSTGPALLFPWSPGWNNVAVMAATQCSTEPVHGLDNTKSSLPSWPPASMMEAPGICAPAVPFPLMPPFWSCMPGYWPNGMWSSPWPGSDGTPNKFTSSGNNSPTLGKHSREANRQEEEKTEHNLWVPKILRIDDPAEASKSSILDALGIKPDEKDKLKSFQSKVLKNDKIPESPQALQANPAAFSRSESFREGLEKLPV